MVKVVYYGGICLSECQPMGANDTLDALPNANGEQSKKLSQSLPEESYKSKVADKSDVIMCYRMILGRDPENENVIEDLLEKKLTPVEIVSAFMSSKEYKINNIINSFDKCAYIYLSRQLSLKERYACFCANMQFLTEVMPIETFELLQAFGRLALGIPQLPRSLHVTLHRTRVVENEGEISLDMSLDDEEIYAISFTICPGSIVSSTKAKVILISRMQGVFGRKPQIVKATRAMKDVTPQSALLQILIGLASAWDISLIAGVRHENQLSYGEDKIENFRSVYDEFLKAAGFGCIQNDFYVVELPVRHTPLGHIKASHRQRTKKKRAFKASLASGAYEAWKFVT